MFPVILRCLVELIVIVAAVYFFVKWFKKAKIKEDIKEEITEDQMLIEGTIEASELIKDVNDKNWAKVNKKIKTLKRRAKKL